MFLLEWRHFPAHPYTTTLSNYSHFCATLQALVIEHACRNSNSMQVVWITFLYCNCSHCFWKKFLSEVYSNHTHVLYVYKQVCSRGANQLPALLVSIAIICRSVYCAFYLTSCDCEGFTCSSSSDCMRYVCGQAANKTSTFSFCSTYIITIL